MTSTQMTPAQMDAAKLAANAWGNFLMAALLLVIRVSGLIVFAPPFSSSNIPVRIKAALTVALALVLTPLAANAREAVHLDISSILGELSVGLLLGLCLVLMQEAMLFAGQLLNLQFGFSLANVLDPGSKVDTPLMSELLNMMFLLVLFAAGLYRVVIEALVRTIVAVPLGHARLDAAVSPAIVSMFGGVLLAGLQLAAPVVAATFLVEIAIALAGKLSPQLPVLIVGIPLKTLTGYTVLLGSLSLWPRFIDAHFCTLLDAAMHLVQGHARAVG